MNAIEPANKAARKATIAEGSTERESDGRDEDQPCRFAFKRSVDGKRILDAWMVDSSKGASATIRNPAIQSAAEASAAAA